jgi:peptidoglycan/xylan/chitin deacetylase (PgdA/CDA1 family)
MSRRATWLDPVIKALDAAHRPVDLFFRDDDVGWGDGRLSRLLDLFAMHALPVDLAVIPLELKAPLARDLCARAEAAPHMVSWHQHGFAHTNHEPTGRKCEFGVARAGWLQRRDIGEGQRRLSDLLGSSDPIFTPPWNRCTPTTGRCLLELGFEVLSREARAVPLAIHGLVELPIQIDWFAHRKGVRLHPNEFGELLARVLERSGCVGLMLHHAAMNSAERAAANELLALFSAHDSVRARRMLELAQQQRRSGLVSGGER